MFELVLGGFEYFRGMFEFVLGGFKFVRGIFEFVLGGCEGLLAMFKCPIVMLLEWEWVLDPNLD